MRNLPTLDEAGIQAVARLEAAVSSRLPVRDFQREVRHFFRRERSRAEMTLTRLHAAPLKKIMDEVLVVARFLRWSRTTAGYVEFPLNDVAPDCWWWRDAVADKVGIEVTAARGKERYYLSRELDGTGLGRGFLKLSDEADNVEYEGAISQPPSAYYTDEFLESFEEGIKGALIRKDDTKFSNMMLLIEAPLNSLPRQRWNRIIPCLKRQAHALPFLRIYVIGNTTVRQNGFRLK